MNNQDEIIYHARKLADAIEANKQRTPGPEQRVLLVYLVVLLYGLIGTFTGLPLGGTVLVLDLFSTPVVMIVSEILRKGKNLD